MEEVRQSCIGAPEEERIENTIDLVASETHMPMSILEAMGSVLNQKTIEGYPGNRYHAGCEQVDVIETLVIDRMKALFWRNRGLTKTNYCSCY